MELSGSHPDLAEFERLLRAELAIRQIDLCAVAGDHGSASIATVVVTARADGASLVVEVRDRVAAKRVSRDLDLAGIPEDGRSLTLAVVADELLRASWAELALATAPAPALPVPDAVRETVRDGLEPHSPNLSTGIETMAVVEHWAGSATLYGADVRVALRHASRFGAALRVGARGAPTTLATDGRVNTTALVGGVSASFRATPSAYHYGLDAIARLDVARIFYVAEPNPGASGAAQADTTLLVGAGIDGWIGLGSRASFVGEALVDAPLRAVTAADGGRQVVGVSGAGIEGGIGIRVAFC